MTIHWIKNWLKSSTIQVSRWSKVWWLESYRFCQMTCSYSMQMYSVKAIKSRHVSSSTASRIRYEERTLICSVSTEVGSSCSSHSSSFLSFARQTATAPQIGHCYTQVSTPTTSPQRSAFCCLERDSRYRYSDDSTSTTPSSSRSMWKTGSYTTSSTEWACSCPLYGLAVWHGR